MKNTITLEIAGAKLKLTADADASHLERLAGIINDRVAALGPRAIQTASPAQILAVIALGLADDWLEAEGRLKAVEEATQSAVTAALDRIDQRLRAMDAAAVSNDFDN